MAENMTDSTHHITVVLNIKKTKTEHVPMQYCLRLRKERTISAELSSIPAQLQYLQALSLHKVLFRPTVFLKVVASCENRSHAFR